MKRTERLIVRSFESFFRISLEKKITKTSCRAYALAVVFLIKDVGDAAKQCSDSATQPASTLPRKKIKSATEPKKLNPTVSAM